MPQRNLCRSREANNNCYHCASTTSVLSQMFLSRELIGDPKITKTYHLFNFYLVHPQAYARLGKPPTTRLGVVIETKRFLNYSVFGFSCLPNTSAVLSHSLRQNCCVLRDKRRFNNRNNSNPPPPPCSTSNPTKEKCSTATIHQSLERIRPPPC